MNPVQLTKNSSIPSFERSDSDSSLRSGSIGSKSVIVLDRHELDRNNGNRGKWEIFKALCIIIFTFLFSCASPQSNARLTISLTESDKNLVRDLETPRGSEADRLQPPTYAFLDKRVSAPSMDETPEIGRHRELRKIFDENESSFTTEAPTVLFNFYKALLNEENATRRLNHSLRQQVEGIANQPFEAARQKIEQRMKVLEINQIETKADELWELRKMDGQIKTLFEEFLRGSVTSRAFASYPEQEKLSPLSHIIVTHRGEFKEIEGDLQDLVGVIPRATRNFFNNPANFAIIREVTRSTYPSDLREFASL